MSSARLAIRPAFAADSEAVVRVVRAVYDEYGFIWDPDGYHADLYDLQGHYLDHGHAFWVAEQEDGTIIGTAALEFFEPLPGEPGTAVTIGNTIRLVGCDCALERLYVDPAARRQGAGGLLVETVLLEARRRGRRALEIWSDKRFGEAHRLYGRFGAVSVAERICHDPDQSPEWGLWIRL
jgi:GNAT superfamily N-acetyltransferase